MQKKYAPNPALGLWVGTQRSQLHPKHKSSFMWERWDRLDKVGFVKIIRRKKVVVGEKERENEEKLVMEDEMVEEEGEEEEVMLGLG